MKKLPQLLGLLLIMSLSSQSVQAQFKFSNLFGGKEKTRKNRIFEPTSTVSLGFGSSSYYGFDKGFVITKIDEKAVTDAKEVAEILANRKGRVKIEGIDVDGTRVIMVL